MGPPRRVRRRRRARLMRVQTLGSEPIGATSRPQVQQAPASGGRLAASSEMSGVMVGRGRQRIQEVFNVKITGTAPSVILQERLNGAARRIVFVMERSRMAGACRSNDNDIYLLIRRFCSLMKTMMPEPTYMYAVASFG